MRRRFPARVGAALVLLVVMGGGPASPAAAQTGSERIRSFEVAIEVQRDGTLLVNERIRYDFGPEERHGIIREIPVRFEYEPDQRYERVTPIEDVSVKAGPNTPDQVESETSGRLKRLRIGDPDRTITGAHDYSITYRVRGALNAFAEHDELFWNVTGNEWQVPIDAVAARVTAPGDVTQVACFVGPLGSRLPCEEATQQGPAAQFAASGLRLGEGLTVVVGLPKGAVVDPDPILDEKWSVSRAFAVTPATVGLSAGLLALVSLGLVRLLWTRGRDRRYAGSHVDVALGSESGQHERVPLFDRPLDPVEFAPPDGVRPGQVGTLVDEAANPLDVTATIVDLAVRGFLRIEEIPKKGLFGKTDWKLIKLKEPEGLLHYERQLHRGLFRDGDEVELSDLKRNFAARLDDVQDALYDEVVAAGWFPSRPDKVRQKWQILGVLAVVLAVGAAVVLAVFTSFGLVGIPLVVGAVGLLAAASRLPHRTPKGFAALRRVNGFRRFIEESEKERARFAERANLFSEYLPYAVVFGATEKWARAFEGLDADVAASTGYWYVSSRPFAIGSFSDSVDDFAVVTSGSIVATAASSGSSGFSGGSSGGGFGGGGGGSW